MKSEVKAMLTALKNERDRLDVAIQALTALAAGPEPVTPTQKRRKMSSEARQRIVDAQKRRWAKVHATNGQADSATAVQ
jgi:hypothetical protein